MTNYTQGFLNAVLATAWEVTPSGDDSLGPQVWKMKVGPFVAWVTKNSDGSFEVLNWTRVDILNSL